MKEDNILEKKIKEGIEQERNEFHDSEPTKFGIMTVVMILLAITIIGGIILSLI